MGLFKKLPDSRRSPAGLERKILRWIPAALTIGLGLLVLPSFILRLTGQQSWASDGVASMTDIYTIGAVLFYCNMIFTVAVGALVVMLMKGPGYVADAYPLSDADAPREKHAPDS